MSDRETDPRVEIRAASTTDSEEALLEALEGLLRAAREWAPPADRDQLGCAASLLREVEALIARYRDPQEGEDDERGPICDCGHPAHAHENVQDETGEHVVDGHHTACFRCSCINFEHTTSERAEAKAEREAMEGALAAHGVSPTKLGHGVRVYKEIWREGLAYARKEAEARERIREHEAENARLREQLKGYENKNLANLSALGQSQERESEMRERIKALENSLREWARALDSSGEGALENPKISSGERSASEFMRQAAREMERLVSPSVSEGESERKEQPGEHWILWSCPEGER